MTRPRDVPEHPLTGRFDGVAEPETRAVRLHGHRIVYRIGGGAPSAERPALVLIHGIAGSSATWNAVLPELSRRYTVVAPDLLGHGLSDKPRHDYSLGAYANQVRDLMIAVGIDRATIVGHSLGGGIALQLAYQHPPRCERLVLVASGGLGPEISWIFRLLSVPGSEYLMPVLFPGFLRPAGNVVISVIHRLGIHAPRSIEEGWRSYATLTERATRDAFLRTLRSVIDPSGQTVSAHDRLYLASAVPTLIVWGRDRIIPVEHAAAALEAMASSQVLIVERAGHFVHVEEPARFVEAIAGFVDSMAPMHLDETDWRTGFIVDR